MEVGLLLIHVVLGTLVAAHGAQKLLGWFNGFGLTGTAGYMESVGLRPGRLMAASAGATEIAGGLALAAGLATPVAAALVAAVMFVAARTDHAGKGLWIYNGGAEYVLTNAAVAIGLAFNGAGTWSVDHAIGWDPSGVAWGLGALGVALAGAAFVLGAVRSAPRAVPSAA